ncbi:unnamed protein product [Prorocentrum cordatum]|uniref:Uncharacterized protein n=1 Tax=Prorocentrum cordatum TaxID=2364126 RepID=A0ABN9QTD2_9DINO|nr:unnamed protein product [Polarella glacialis]
MALGAWSRPACSGGRRPLSAAWPLALSAFAAWAWMAAEGAFASPPVPAAGQARALQGGGAAALAAALPPAAARPARSSRALVGLGLLAAAALAGTLAATARRPAERSNRAAAAAVAAAPFGCIEETAPQTRPCS